jgi:hypothetical protein
MERHDLETMKRENDIVIAETDTTTPEPDVTTATLVFIVTEIGITVIIYPKPTPNATEAITAVAIQMDAQASPHVTLWAAIRVDITIVRDADTGIREV